MIPDPWGTPYPLSIFSPDRETLHIIFPICGLDLPLGAQLS